MMDTFAQVVVDIAISQVDKPFDYLVPPEFLPVELGMQVRVTFKNMVKTGIVVGLSHESDQPKDKVKSITHVGQKVLSVSQVELAKWMQNEYHCTLASCLRLMIPPTVRKMHEYKKEGLARLVAKDQVDTIIEALPASATRQRQALHFMKDRDEVPLTLLGGLSIIRPLIQKDIVSVRYVDVESAPMIKAAIPVQAPKPTVAQQHVMDQIHLAQTKGDGAFLLHGTTGSGKTEVYLSAVQTALQLGKCAIVLVPEIALTPQMVSRFSERLGKDAAVLHSRLTEAQRKSEWTRLSRGDAKVAIGARSAIFAPIASVGLVIVDEEHENSYKSEQTPRYDAVEVAMKRATLEGATLVLGSATPSLERYIMAKEGMLQLLEMPTRVGDKPMPQVVIVDMRQELLNGNRTMFSQKLQDNMRQCLDHGEQIMLFLNRRGHSTFVSCRACGKAIECPHCQVTMTYHLGENKLRCHYCDAQMALPTSCPHCASMQIRQFGAGTEKLEQEVNKLFPHAKTLRMDADTTKGRDAHERLLNVFRQGEAQILIGTQMIAKGHDFPNVTLVGVIAADVSLRLPDFRAQEKTFQLLCQVAGRAGRGDKQGAVIVQTYMPEEPAIGFAQNHDYHGFFEREILRRRQSQYPPFGSLLRLVFAGEDEALVEKTTRDVYALWQQKFNALQLSSESLLFDGCMPAPIARLAGKWRYQILIRTGDGMSSKQIEHLLYDLARGLLPRGVICNFEVNPQNMI